MHRALSLAMIGVTLLGCQDHVFAEPLDTGLTDTSGADYPSEVSAVFSNNSCTSAGCHGGGSSSGGVSLDEGSCDDTAGGGAVVSGDASSSPLWLELDAGTMPIGGDAVSQDELDAIAAWIDGGAVCDAR